MYVRIVHHWCKPGRIADGRAFMDNVGATTAAVSGFLYRYRMESADDPDLLTTLTAWQDRSAFEAFQRTRKPSDHSDPDNPFLRTSQQFFDVTGVTEKVG